MDFHEKRKFKRLLYSKLTIIIFALIVIWLSFSVFDMYKKEKDTRLNRIEQENILDELKSREAVLREEINRLSTDRGVEEEIRSKFEVGKKGEEVIIIVDSPDDDEIKETNLKKSFWQKIFNWF